jgi:hypothetical protein
MQVNFVSNSMEQSPSWEPNGSSACQEIFWTPNVHYCVYINPPLLRILRQEVQSTASNPFLLSSTSVASYHQGLLFRLSHKSWSFFFFINSAMVHGSVMAYQSDVDKSGWMFKTRETAFWKQDIVLANDRMWTSKALYIYLLLSFNLLTGHDVYVHTRIALFHWVWCTIMSSIFHH